MLGPSVLPGGRDLRIPTSVKVGPEEPRQDDWAHTHTHTTHVLAPVCTRIKSMINLSEKSWDTRDILSGWSIRVSLEHYRCQKVVAKDFRAKKMSDKIKFRYQNFHPRRQREWKHRKTNGYTKGRIT